MRTRPGRVETEVYFRIVHAAQHGHNGAPAAPYHEQTGVNAAQAMIDQQRATFTTEDEAASGFSNQPGQLRNQPCHMQMGKIFFLADVNKPPIFANRYVSPVC